MRPFESLVLYLFRKSVIRFSNKLDHLKEDKFSTKYCLTYFITHFRKLECTNPFLERGKQIKLQNQTQYSFYWYLSRPVIVTKIIICCATLVLIIIFPIFRVIIESPGMCLSPKINYMFLSPIVILQLYFLCRISTRDVYSSVIIEFWQKITVDGGGLIDNDYEEV